MVHYRFGIGSLVKTAPSPKRNFDGLAQGLLDCYKRRWTDNTKKTSSLVHLNMAIDLFPGTKDVKKSNGLVHKKYLAVNSLKNNSFVLMKKIHMVEILKWLRG